MERKRNMEALYFNGDDMIFVTVGTDEHDFSRLVKKMDMVAKKTRDKIIMQIGHTKYEPKNCEYYRFVPPKKFQELVKRSGIVVTHGGEGCIMTSLKFNKPTIVVPRLKKYNEHVDDHQLDLTDALEKENKIISILDVDDLEHAIKKAKHMKIKTTPDNGRIIRIIEEFIRNH